MLPGFRFLFAAVVPSMSVLIFGVGAAALLRSAHDVSLPTRPQEQVFAPQVNAARAMLAVLRVDAASPDQNGSAQSAVVNALLAARSIELPPRVASTSVERSGTSAKPEVAALTAVAPFGEKSQPPETRKPEVKDTAVAVLEQVSAPTKDAASLASTNIATLGGAPVTINTQTAPKTVVTETSKRAKTRRVVKQSTLRTQQADPFASLLRALATASGASEIPAHDP
jgi:hypothetical protein